MNIAKVRKFLMEWVLPPRGIRAVCFVMSRVLPCRSTLALHRKRSKRLFVLVNGPSLSRDLERYGEDIATSDRLTVNFMGTTELYEKIRPTMYLLADPAYFSALDELNEGLRAKVTALKEALREKTSWDMELIVPDCARNSDFVQSVLANKRISVVCYSTCVPRPMDSEDMYGWLRNWYAPPTLNVLGTATYLGICWRYETVVLAGADMSFHAVMRVEQDTNRLYREDEHYYGKEKLYMYCDRNEKTPRHLADALLDTSQVFGWFERLRMLADYAGVRVVNASSFSWIDAFERPQMGDGGR